MTNIAHSALTGSDLHEPKGADTATAGQVYVSDGAGSGAWTDTGATIGLSNFSTGDLKPTLKTTPDSGWIMCDDGTIGDLSSGATNLASATTQDLFTLLWTNFANTECPVSGGSRGLNAAADYAAHKTIRLPQMLGRVYGIAGNGSGLSSRTIGSTTGEENHALVTAELPSVTPAGTISNVISGGVYGGTALNNTDPPHNIQGTVFNGSPIVVTSTFNGTPFGGNAAHNTMQPTVFLKMMVKL